MSDISRAITAKQAQIQRLQADIDALQGAASILGQKKPATGTLKRKRRRRKMSAAAKKAVSKRMKAYWAKRRNAKK